MQMFFTSPSLRRALSLYLYLALPNLPFLYFLYLFVQISDEIDATGGATVPPVHVHFPTLDYSVVAFRLLATRIMTTMSFRRAYRR